MLRSKRGILVAFAGLALLALLIYGGAKQIHYEQQAQDRSIDYASRQADQIIEFCLATPAIERAPCLRKGANEYRLKARDNQREYEDLAAQKTSALWTSIMGFAALIGMALSAVGLGLVWTTFKETQNANKIAQRDSARATRRAISSADETTKALEAANLSAEAAKKTADAADKTAKAGLEANQISQHAADDARNAHRGQMTIALRTEERQLRAYVFMDELETKVILKGSNAVSSWHIRFNWFNKGRTPASYVRSACALVDFDGDIPTDFDYPTPNGKGLHFTSLGPDMGLRMSPPDPPKWLLEAMLVGSRQVYLYSFVEYDDAIPGSTRRRTEMCVRLSANRDLDGGYVITADSFGPFNGFDEGCYKDTETSGRPNHGVLPLGKRRFRDI